MNTNPARSIVYDTAISIRCKPSQFQQWQAAAARRQFSSVRGWIRLVLHDADYEFTDADLESATETVAVPMTRKQKQDINALAGDLDIDRSEMMRIMLDAAAAAQLDEETP